ncbi:MAG TPA: tetratricopeptide repeat protein [Solirubrobacteraceae bacterium]|nr:tetratricopeptide repeat protein [Solirubrobacteraceae bacterium]
MRRILIAAIATFAVALPVAILMARGGAPPNESAAKALPPAAPPNASTDVRIRDLQATVRAAPKRADGWTLLAGAYLQKVRETGDAGFYVRAQGAVDRALKLRPGDAGALTQRSALELSRHNFRAGLADAQRARAAAPAINQPFGTLVDALVELGRYDAAGRALQEMVDRDPNLAAYARVSYFRELHGDLRGALSAMQDAVSAGGAVPENDAYVRSLVGGLQLQRGRVGAAERAYRGALQAVPGYPAAEAGLAQTDVARGRFAPAIARLSRVIERLPLPAYVIALGEAQAAAGRRAAARQTFDLVRVEVMLQQRAGVNADVELALFEADHGSPRRAVDLGRRAWAAAPSVRSADALGWALHKAGHARAALGWARRALALGSRDPAFLLHAGLIARAADRPDLAKRWLAGARAGRAALTAGLREQLR